MLRVLHTLVFALVAVFGIASGAHASGSETALRQNFEHGPDRVGDFELEALGTRQQNASHATTIASGSSHAARGSAAEGLAAAESWGNPSTLFRHFDDHGANFGSASAEAYATDASAFLQRAMAENLPTKIDSSGVIRVFEPSTNTFGSFNANGTTRTFFTPSSPTYWFRQAGAEPWTPGVAP
jgi:hypothetical protein